MTFEKHPEMAQECEPFSAACEPSLFDARRAITNEKESSQRTQRTKLNSYTLTFDVAIFV